MTKTGLLERRANGDSSTVELRTDAIEPHRLARELVGFLNSYGGVVLLGVEDDKWVSGIRRSHTYRPESKRRTQLHRDYTAWKKTGREF